MRRHLLSAFLCAALLAPPAVALAHDPLDDVSGEEDLSNTEKKEEAKPSSHKKERQEAELNKEEQEHEEAEFHLNQEKDEFFRDRADTKDVLDGQRRRAQLAGSNGARPHKDAPPPVHHEDATPVSAKPKHSDDAAPRGDVDPTDPGASGDKKSGGDDDDAPKKKKKKHSDDE